MHVTSTSAKDPLETRMEKRIRFRTRSTCQSNQPTLNPICERTGRPVFTHDVINVSDSSQTRSAHGSETFNVGDETLRERTERSIADHDVSHESIMVNETDMDFRIPGPPNSVVKHAQSSSVRELILKIENHPDRRALQQDLRQNQSFNPFSPESKQMIQDVGHIELCELLKTEPKAQCTVCLSYWNTGVPCCTYGHFLHKERGIRKSSNIRWTFFQSLSVSSRRDDLMDIHMAKNRETNNIVRLNQLKKKCKTRDFQGIDDRFLRDQEFRVRMIENHRDEDLCRRWDALADEDHTHHLTAQEYLH